MKASYYRGVVSSKVVRSTDKKYSMISVGLSQADTNSQMSVLEREQPQRFKTTDMTISCINSPSNVTVSGPRDQLSLLLLHLQKQNIFARQLMVDVAYHSPQMDIVALEYMEHLEFLEKRDTPSNTRMISSVTCTPVKADIACNGKYWVQNLVSPVQFSKAMTLCSSRSSKEVIKMLDRSHLEEVITDVWIELGPHSALRGPIRDILKSLGRSNEVTYDSALVRDSPASDTFLSSVGRLYCQNTAIDLAKLNLCDGTSASPLAVLPDIPQYPFNHSTIYWEESQSSRSLLFREHASHDLLGAQVIDWNPMEAKWSFIIKAENLPWIADHKVNGSIIYPAAGILAAAVEAVKMVTKDVPPTGYEIREAEFEAPLLLTTAAKGTEIQFSLYSPSRFSARNNPNYQFRVFLRKSHNSWEAISHGSIRADYGRVASDVDGGREADELLSQIKTLHGEASASCSCQVDTVKMYRQLREEVGIDYGPSFQVLSNIHYNAQHEAIATIETSREQVKHPSASCVVHPTTLDGLFQLIFVALTRGANEISHTMVPTRVGRMWISPLAEETSSPASLQVYTRARLFGKRGARCCISALDCLSQALRIDIQDFEVTAVSGPSSLVREEAKRLCHHISWKPDLDTLSSQDIQKYCASSRQDEFEPIQWFNDLELLTLCFGAQALKSSGVLVKDIKEGVPYLHRYVFWLQAKIDQYLAASPVEKRQQRKDLLEDKAHLEALRARVDVNKRGQLYAEIGKELHDMLVEDTNPLELLFSRKKDLLTDFYTELNMSSQAFDAVACYLDILVHKTPNLKFIEIGAGTGATTRSLLRALAGPRSTPLFKQYTFTDISPAFLENARENFSGQKRLDFVILDIEEDPCAQGFLEAQYDVLIASLVFHATRDLDMTLKRARKLLKPGGKLILMELTEPERVSTGFVFGLLPGWWSGTESFRQQSPCISVKQWNETLLNNGFSGNDLVFRDYRSEECRRWSIIISTAVAPPSEAAEFPNVNLVLDKDSEDQCNLAEELTKTDGFSRGPVRRLTLEEAALSPEPGAQHHVIIVDYMRYTLSNIKPAAFASLQRLLSMAASVIWVTRCGGEAPSSPHHGVLQGLSRACRVENPRTPFVTVALETTQGHLSLAKDAATILKVCKMTAAGLANQVFEPEYTEIDGLLHINRLVEAEKANAHVFLKTAQPVCTRDFENLPPLRLNVRTPGLLDSLEFVEDISFEEPIAPDEIEVDVHAIGINFKDVLTVLGRVDSDKLGSECAGVIRHVGEGCSQLQPGDRVTLCDLDCYRTRVRVKETQAIKIPDKVSFVEAASIPTAFCTAFYSLVEVGRLQKEESVLIHAGSGGTGQAAIQVAAHIGAEIFATVGSMQKKRLLMERYGLDENHIFYSRDTSFADGIKRMTRGRGVDLVLNSLSGDGLIASWECVAPFGRFLEIGRRDVDSRGQLPMAPFVNNLSFICIDLAAVLEQRQSIGRRILQTAVSMFEAQKLHPPYPLHTYQLQDIEKAFRFLQSGKSSGKVVLEVNRLAKLRVSPIRLVLVNVATMLILA
jgi:NADPH:quinone reductase-like Zn-dependent oxidoreductase/SAM-dependent methyltransferase